jgi:nitroreductase
MPAAGPDVLSEAAAVEVLAYLITAARTQLDEAAEYAPLRLLTAAHRLAGHMAPHASTPVRQLIATLDSMPPTATPRDRDAYIAKVDEICVALADCLLALYPPAEEE